jgi:hypothetical protein
MPHRLKNNASRYLSSAVNWEYLINADGSLTNELRLMINLMNTTGVYHLKTKEDLWLLSYRCYMVFGVYISYDLLFLEEVFFKVYTDRFDGERDFTLFMLDTLKKGNVTSIQTNELINFIGVQSKVKENASNDKFEGKLILKAKSFWLHDKDLIFFPATTRNRDFRKILLKGKVIPEIRKKEAQKWADLIVKYL